MSDVTVGLWVTLEAKPGKETEVADFLRGGQAIVEGEPGTVTWYAVQLGATTFGIFDTFADDSGRQAHLSGEGAAALGQIAPELRASPPDIRPVDVLAVKR